MIKTFTRQSTKPAGARSTTDYERLWQQWTKFRVPYTLNAAGESHTNGKAEHHRVEQWEKQLLGRLALHKVIFDADMLTFTNATGTVGEFGVEWTTPTNATTRVTVRNEGRGTFSQTVETDDPVLTHNIGHAAVLKRATSLALHIVDHCLEPYAPVQNQGS